MNAFTKMLSGALFAPSDLKNELYDRAFMRPVDCGVPVISFGNLTVGGTGKTPIVDFSARLLAPHAKVGILCRSYRASASEPGRVDPAKPEVFGDEACWYARRHPSMAVWSGPRKWETALAMAKTETMDVILLDDGFQHRRLRRALDLVLLDATDDETAYDAFPMGRARERFEDLRRADAVLLTKTNLASPGRVEWLKSRLADVPVFSFRSRLLAPESPPPGEWMIVSGIARPDAFRRLVEELRPGRAPREMIFRDHHRYDERDVERIQAQAAGAAVVFTTEKDFVKLRPLWRGEIPLKALSLDVSLQESVESYHALLRRALA